ncbi:hypothetical protein R3I94_012503 [Phoxinus phoxinus]
MHREEGKTTDDVYENVEVIREKFGREITDSSTTSDSVKIRSYRAATGLLVTLCVLQLTAVIVLCVHMETQSKNYTEERHQLLTNNTYLIQLNEQLNREKNELWNLTQEGWIFYQFSFYYVSTEMKSWNESRRNCTERGADLIKIKSTEEQDFARKITCRSEFWIGLTDNDEEGIWKWVDGSTLTSGIWTVGQPNGKRTQNCVVSSLTWGDSPCNTTYKWICERSILPVVLP